MLLQPALFGVVEAGEVTSPFMPPPRQHAEMRGETIRSFRYTRVMCRSGAASRGVAATVVTLQKRQRAWKRAVLARIGRYVVGEEGQKAFIRHAKNISGYDDCRSATSGSY